MISINTKKKEKKEYTETIRVPVYYATADNAFGLQEGWYEWAQDSPVPREECGVLEVAFLPNEPYRRYLRDQALKHKKKMRRGRLSQDKIDEIDIRAVALFGLKSWEGFNDKESGEETGYDPEIGFNALWNDRAFLDFVCDLCRDEELFDIQGDIDEEQDQVKN